MEKIWIGCAGWAYPDWAGSFYPPDMPRKDWLKYYASVFNSVELNYSFYHLPLEKTLLKWNQESGGLLWAVKASKYITHIKRLKDCAEALSTFTGRLGLLKNLGPVLLQLPPNLKFDRAAFGDFTSILPKGLRYTVEPRHESWFTKEFLGELEKRNIALCVSDTAGKYPYCEAVTAAFVYVRLHGHKQLYRSLYSAGELAAWVRRLKTWKREVFVYFDNTMDGNAPKNAAQLKGLLCRPARGCYRTRPG